MKACQPTAADHVGETVSEECRCSEECKCKEVCRFLGEFAATLLASGATCIRLEKNLHRMARTFGKAVDMTIMPRHVYVTVHDKDRDENFTTITAVPASPISFRLNTLLSQLSWRVADEGLSLRHAEREFREIRQSDRQNPWLTLFLASMANASFCGIFGGDAVSMVIVFVATALGFHLKQTLTRHRFDGRVVFFICALVSTVIGSAGYLFHLGTTPGVAIGTSVLYLVPGIPLLNSFSDLLYKHYICAFSRFLDAVVLLACLSLGLCLGMRLVNVDMF